MTNIVTKNGAVIVKDGKAAADCSCCGGWWCNTNSCVSCQIGAYNNTCNPDVSESFVSCTQTSGWPCFIMEPGYSCDGIPLTVALSGFGDVERISGPGSLGMFEGDPSTLSTCNKTLQASEVCWQASNGISFNDSAVVGRLLVGGAYYLGTSVGFAARYSSQYLNDSPCPDGMVVLQCHVGATVTYDESFGTSDFRMQGQYESPLVAASSLPRSGSMLKGKSLSIQCDGMWIYNNYFVRVYLASQTITVNFS